MDIHEFDLNIELRSIVLRGALEVEKSINDLIKLYLDLSYENLRAFGHDSSNIPFAGKLNILLDIGVFRDEKGKAIDLYNDCVFLSQIRNKIAHVYECNSFEAMFTLMKGGNKLMEYIEDSKRTENDEANYQLAYLNLCKKCQISLVTMIAEKEIKIECKRGMVNAIMSLYKHELDMSVYYKKMLLDFVTFDCKGDIQKFTAFQKEMGESLKKKKLIAREKVKSHNDFLEVVIAKGYTIELLLETM